MMVVAETEVRVFVFADTNLQTYTSFAAKAPATCSARLRSQQPRCSQASCGRFCMEA